MTGLHTGHTRIRGNFGKGGVIGLAGKEGRVPLRDEDLTIAEVLQDKGYRTGMVGKWGLGEPNTTVNLTKKVLTTSMAFTTKEEHIPIILNTYGKIPIKLMLFGNEKEQNHQYTHSLFADKAINFIDRNHQTPFSSTCRFVFLTADTNFPTMVFTPTKKVGPNCKKYVL